MAMVMVTTALETMRMTAPQSAELRANSVGLVAQTPTVMGSVMEMEPAMARAILVLILHRLTHCSQSTPMVMPTLTTILMAKAD